MTLIVAAYFRGRRAGLIPVVAWRIAIKEMERAGN